MHAIIPAAGHSRRMGQPKLALPLGQRTVLQRVIDALHGAGVEAVVVLGPHVAGLAESAAGAGASVVQLSQPTRHMRETIERGLEHLEKLRRPGPDEPWLLVPADHPVLESSLIRALIDALERRPDCSIAVPVHRGKRGHPALIRWRHVAGIRAAPTEQGLNDYLRRYAAETLEVPVDSPDVLLDLDTPEDYEQLRARFV